jgi:hypothetical protein
MHTKRRFCCVNSSSNTQVHKKRLTSRPCLGQRQIDTTAAIEGFLWMWRRATTPHDRFIHSAAFKSGYLLQKFSDFNLANNDETVCDKIVRPFMSFVGWLVG